jgi:hypothetical protein
MVINGTIFCRLMLSKIHRDASSTKNPRTMNSQDAPPNKKSSFLSPRAKALLLRSLALAAAVGGAVCFFGGMQNVNTARQNDSWPTATGTILKSEVKTVADTNANGHKRTMYQADVMYEYKVRNVVVHGSRIAIGSRASTDQAAAQRLVDQYPVGKEVTVRFEPGNFQSAILEGGATPQVWLMPGLGVAFLGLAVVFGLWMPRYYK